MHTMRPRCVDAVGRCGATTRFMCRIVSSSGATSAAMFAALTTCGICCCDRALLAARRLLGCFSNLILGTCCTGRLGTGTPVLGSRHSLWVVSLRPMAVLCATATVGSGKTTA